MIKHVRNREAEQLEAVITANSPQGPTHITDGWRGYLGLSALGFSHFNVNHEECFVDPLTGYHTQDIECLWALLRADFRRFRGLLQDKLQAYLDEFAFRRNMRMTDDGLWINMLLVIGDKQQHVQMPAY